MEPSHNTYDFGYKKLRDTVQDALRGKIQLPDFQRQQCWRKDDVRAFLASVACRLPLASIHLLNCRRDAPFGNRPLNGGAEGASAPSHLVIDGQQRITTCMQALTGDGLVYVKDKNKCIRFYIDMNKAIRLNATEFIESIYTDDEIRKRFQIDPNDIYTLSKRMIFPLNHVFDKSEYKKKLEKSNKSFDEYTVNQRIDIYENFEQNIIQAFNDAIFGVIYLKEEMTNSEICLTYERLNTQGRSLTGFDLVAAKMAVDHVDIMADWSGDGATGERGIKEKLKSPDLRPLGIADRDDFLAAITHASNHLAGRTGSSRHADALLLSPDEYQLLRDEVVDGMQRTARLLQDESVFDQADVPYKHCVIVLIALFAVLGRSAESASAVRKLRRWLWVAAYDNVFQSSAYKVGQRELDHLVHWLRNDVTPPSVERAAFDASRVNVIRNKRQAAHAAVKSLIIREGARDPATGMTMPRQMASGENADLHHIFPKSWCKKNNIPEWKVENIANKTPITSLTEKEIGSRSPSKYLENIEKAFNISPESLDELLKSHMLDPTHLRNDDFDAFFEDRKKKIVQGIERDLPGLVTDDADNEEREDAAPPHPASGNRAAGSKKNMPKIRDLLDSGRIVEGQTLKILGKSDARTARIVNDNTVNVDGHHKTYNEWVCDEMGWKAANIYPRCATEDGITLDRHRRELMRERENDAPANEEEPLRERSADTESDTVKSDAAQPDMDHPARSVEDSEGSGSTIPERDERGYRLVRAGLRVRSGHTQTKKRI